MVEEVFAQAWDAEGDLRKLLGDEGWKLAETEPETVKVNGNGHYDAIGPTVELVPVNGHAPANGNGNGHHGDADDPQQSLFAWAEFMAEEPVKPKRKNGKPQPASISMFEWALEQERDKETVGVGR